MTAQTQTAAAPVNPAPPWHTSTATGSPPRARPSTRSSWRSQGTLASVEMEVETAIARTSRSPMIRDAHDFRAGIHDRQLRKLTGRSYSALVHPGRP